MDFAPDVIFVVSERSERMINYKFVVSGPEKKLTTNKKIKKLTTNKNKKNKNKINYKLLPFSAIPSPRSLSTKRDQVPLMLN